MLIIAVFNIIINTDRKERHEEINPEILFRYK